MLLRNIIYVILKNLQSSKSSNNVRNLKRSKRKFLLNFRFLYELNSINL